jgi:hypothetical protein
LNNGAFQTSNVFNNVVAGSYNVVVKDAKACTTSKSITLIEPRRRHNFKAKVFPNPSTNYFRVTIESEKIWKPVQIIVTNSFGVVVYKSPACNRQDFTFGNNFAPGIYMVNIKIGDKEEAYKVIKQ